MSGRPPGDPAADFAAIMESRRRSLVKVDQPVVLISQLPRSGGSLLLRLFDGHPQCHTFPHEFGGELGREISPEGGPAEAWAKIHIDKLEDWFSSGFGVAQRKNSDKKAMVRVPLLIAPSFQRALFHEHYPSRDDFSERKVIDAYLTSYFNAWIDNQNLFSTPKNWVVAFEPQAIFTARYRERFTQLYPDCRFISIVREPQSWFASAQGWSLEWPSVRPALESWRDGVETLLETKRENPDRIAIVLFSDLVQRTEDMMRTLGKWLGIRNSREWTKPTFNGRPIVPNTSFQAKTNEVSRDPLKRGRTLKASERGEIDRLAGDLMGKVTEVAMRPAVKTAKATKRRAKSARKKSHV